MQKIIITAADNMSEETYQRICCGFREKLGDAEFTRVTDNGIIGGFIADVGGEIYDMSISAQLEQMKRQITG